MSIHTIIHRRLLQNNLFDICVLKYDLMLYFDRPMNEPTREKSHSVHFESVVDLAGPVSDSMTMHKEMVSILLFEILCVKEM